MLQTGSKLEAFFAAFSRKTRVQRRTAYAKRIGIAVRKRYMSTPFEGAWTVTIDFFDSRIRKMGTMQEREKKYFFNIFIILFSCFIMFYHHYYF